MISAKVNKQKGVSLGWARFGGVAEASEPQSFFPKRNLQCSMLIDVHSGHVERFRNLSWTLPISPKVESGMQSRWLEGLGAQKQWQLSDCLSTKMVSVPPLGMYAVLTKKTFR